MSKTSEENVGEEQREQEEEKKKRAEEARMLKYTVSHFQNFLS